MTDFRKFLPQVGKAEIGPPGSGHDGRGTGHGPRGSPGFIGLGFQPVARAIDGEALFVQQIADAPDQQDLVMLVIAPVAAP